MKSGVVMKATFEHLVENKSSALTLTEYIVIQAEVIPTDTSSNVTTQVLPGCDFGALQLKRKFSCALW